MSALLDEVIAAEVLPRFRLLTSGDIEAKPTAADPEDLVTIVDRLVERRLEAALAALLPGSLVVGEEAVHADPRRLDALGGPAPVWLIDPIDGTRNFARGDDAFGVMVALVEAGATRAAWITLPVRGQRFVAEAGAGAFLDGHRLRVQPPAARWRGTVYARYMPPAVSASVERSLAGRHEPTPGPMAAAVEYTGLARGEKDFVLYHRLLPWDHAPGALVLSEAGGRVEHLDGRAYTPHATSQVTILAVAPAVSETLRGWLNDG